MDKLIIKEALEESLYLINQEIESVVIDDLKEDYLIVIKKIEKALKEIEK